MFRPFLHSKFLLLACAIFLGATTGLAQSVSTARIQALEFLQKQPSDFNLSAQDISDTRVTDEYTTRHNGLTHIWIQQQYKGIPVFNALMGLHVSKDGKVYHPAHRFVKNLQDRVNTSLPSLSAAKALEMAMANVGFGGFALPSLRQKINERNFVYQGGAISRSDIPVSACYTVTRDGSVRLSWTMVIDQANTSDVWNIRVDALTGLVIDKFSQTQHCSPGSFMASSEIPVQDCVSMPEISTTTAMEDLLVDEKYNVFALPVESPAHGARSIVTNPHDLLASPYGWLDTNGVAGPEFTYTRGNNTWAFDNSTADNVPVPIESPDAGASLNFDFPYDPNLEPAANSLAAVTNLFYITNKVHDITYRYGFDEEAGNFQTKNYSNLGEGDDAVLAQGLDGSGNNNADFSTFPDGFAGRMRMFLWNATGGGIVKVNAPATVGGTYFGGTTNGWGGVVTNVPLTAEAVFVNDGAEPAEGCEPPSNNVAGKIVMINRGTCEFGTKALLAEQAGAVACIICDHGAPPLSGQMAPGDDGGLVTIPTVWMKKVDCDLLRQYAGNGLNISLVQPSIGPGPLELDGAFDNGIVSHELGHGISNRLTGGPSNTGCLSNAENMGEGWSDFFALTNTVRPGDVGTVKRGMGTFVFREPNDANGTRRYPYSTDMTVNPLTFSTVGENPETHALGEVWTAMTWDLYWAMVEKYGYDANINNTNSGNFRAVQLVMDGMKLQPCSPGFQDGRDAIVLADLINYNGADTCLISSVFARRGLGYYSTQNDREVATDGVENFDPIPTCVKELKIKKITTTPTLVPGNNAEFVITITNHKDEAAPDVVVTDELPTGLSLVSASNGGTLSGNMVMWNLGTLQPGVVVSLTYTAKSSNIQGSLSYFHDIMDNTDENWYSLSSDPANVALFELENDDVHSGTAAWRGLEASNVTTDFTLETTQSLVITGAKPIIRFWHKYNTEPSADAGFLEFLDQNDPNPIWRRLTNAATFRNGYDGKVSYATFAFPNHYGFSGNSDGWKQSYFDMSSYLGKNITFRFRFGTDDNTAAAGGGYWIVDEVEAMDMFNYDTEACVSSGSDHACDRADEAGIIMEAAVPLGASEPAALEIPMLVQPNPSSDFLYVSIAKAIQGQLQWSLMSADGRTVLRKTATGLQSEQVTTFDVQNLAAGVYMLQLESAEYRSMAKIVIR